MDLERATTSSNNSSSDVFAVGIDLGTTFTSVGVYFNGNIDIVCDEFGSKQFPSRVGFTADTHFVGQNVNDAPNLVDTNVIFDAKRLIGRKFSDPSVKKDKKRLPFKMIKHARNDWVKIVVAYKNKTIELFPESVSALVLSNAKRIVEKKYETKITEAVITVPAYFDNSQRETTKFAGHLAGFKTVYILNAPTSAAIGYITKYGIRTSKRTKFLIFDLGGGTHDVSIVNATDSLYSVEVTEGDSRLGGQDFTRNLVKLCAEKIKQEFNVDIDMKSTTVMEVCENAKRALSCDVETQIPVCSLSDGYPNEKDKIKVTRLEFEQKNDTLFQSAISRVEMALLSVGLRFNDVHYVILTGGSSRMPKIHTLLSNLFGESKIVQIDDLDELVVYGAAVRAAMLKQQDSIYDRIQLTDIVPISVGVRALVNYNPDLENESSDDDDDDDDEDEKNSDSDDTDEIKIVNKTIPVGNDDDIAITEPQVETIEISDSEDDDNAVAAKKPRAQQKKYSEIMEKLILKNSNIPTMREKVTLEARARHNCTDILEGEHLLARKNKILGTVVFERKDMSQRMVETDVCMQVDRNGIIKVAVYYKNTDDMLQELEITGSVPWDNKLKSKLIDQHNTFIQNADAYEEALKSSKTTVASTST